MPNSKDRKKKDGQNVGKTIKARKEAEAERKENARPDPDLGDQGDVIAYKSGSAGDRTRVGTR